MESFRQLMSFRSYNSDINLFEIFQKSMQSIVMAEILHIFVSSFRELPGDFCHNQSDCAGDGFMQLQTF